MVCEKEGVSHKTTRLFPVRGLHLPLCVVHQWHCSLTAQAFCGVFRHTVWHGAAMSEQ
jgi:hypothetical protein